MLDIRQRTGYLFLAIVIGHIILISAQVQSKSGGKVLGQVTFGVFAVIEHGTAGVLGGVQHVWRDYVALRGVKSENDALKRELDALRVQLNEQQALVDRTARLQQLLNLRGQVSLPTTAASIIGGDATPGLQTITIDKGERDGVAPDMAVISPAGIVGRVFEKPAAHAARVQLIIGRNAGAGAMIQRSRAGGVIVGGGQDPPLTMEYVSNLADVKVGDMVITAGTDGIYPKGLPIGRVESIERGALYRTIRVRPVVDFSNIEEVLVVLASPPAEKSDKLETADKTVARAPGEGQQ